MMHTQSTSSSHSPSNLSKTKTILFFGASCSGKTSLLLQLTKNRFDDEYQTTIGVNYYFKEMAVVTLSLWDTRGSEISEGFLPKHLFASASCFIIVLSYDDIDSLNEAILYIDFIKSQCDFQHSTTVMNSYKPIIAVINKKDIKDKQFRRGEAVVALREACPNILVGEITAKDGVMVKRFFEKVEMLLLFGKVRKSRGEGNDDDNDGDGDDVNEEGDHLLMVASTFRINDEKGNDNQTNVNKKRKKNKKCCNNN